MNKTIVILIIFCLFMGSNISHAQIMVGDPYFFCAMNGSCYNQSPNRWVTIVDNDYTPSTAAYVTEQFMNAHPGFDLLSPASLLYNCHGYAYSTAQGGEFLQIGWKENLCSFNGSNSESYVIVPESLVQQGDIASIIKNESGTLVSCHSAIVYNTDTLISKWGNYPLFKHYKYDPWIVSNTGLGTESNYVYYRRVINDFITGPTIFDGSGTYTFIPDVAPTSCTWSVEPADMFQTSSGSGYTANLTYKTPFTHLAYGATITFTFSYSCDNYYSVSKDINLIIPTTTISGVAVSDGFIVKNPDTVTVTGEIRSNPNARAIVPIGSRLVIDGGSMKSNGNFMWPGIEVWGNSSSHQNMVNGNYSQGYLELKNGASIENAVCAVELWHPGVTGTTGGIVHADSAFFINNAKAVHALDYSYLDPSNGQEMAYNASFHNCCFAVNDDYLGSETFHHHVDIARVKGIEFEGCSFSVDPDASGISSWCSAIDACDASFSAIAYCDQHGANPNIFPCPDENLVRCSFSGFHNAVHSVHDGATVRSFHVKDALFSDNNVGVYALNSGYATVVRNSFDVGRDEECAFGVYADGVSGFCIEENDFSPSDAFLGESIGIGIFNSQGANDVYLNSFDGMDCGNLAVGENTAKTQGFSGLIVNGLSYSCNQNTLNGTDFCVLSGDGGGIRPQQGSMALPAGNTFGASAFHFYNGGDDSVDYYYNASASGQTPSSSLLHHVNRVATNAQNGCASHYGLGSVIKSGAEKTRLEADFHDAHDDAERLAKLYRRRLDEGGSADDLGDLAAQIAQRVHDRSLAAGDIVRSVLNENNADPAELRTWLRNMGDIASERLAVASYIQEGDFDGAFALAQSLPSLYGLVGDELYDHNDYLRLIGLYRSLRDSGRSTAQLTAEERLLVDGIAANASASGSLARALLDGITHGRSLEYDCPSLPNSRNAGRGLSSQSEERKKGVYGVSANPNPVLSWSEVRYDLPEGTSRAHLLLTNALGVKIAARELVGSQGVVTLDLRELPPGIYLLTVDDNNGKTYTDKIVKQ